MNDPIVKIYANPCLQLQIRFRSLSLLIKSFSYVGMESMNAVIGIIVHKVKFIIVQRETIIFQAKTTYKPVKKRQKKPYIFLFLFSWFAPYLLENYPQGREKYREKTFPCISSMSWSCMLLRNQHILSKIKRKHSIKSLSIVLRPSLRFLFFPVTAESVPLGTNQGSIDQ